MAGGPPPAMVTAQKRNGVMINGIILGGGVRASAHLPQATLEKEKGLPTSRFQRKIELEEERGTTYNTTPWVLRRRGGFGEAEASFPSLSTLAQKEYIGEGAGNELISLV